MKNRIILLSALLLLCGCSTIETRIKELKETPTQELPQFIANMQNHPGWNFSSSVDLPKGCLNLPKDEILNRIRLDIGFIYIEEKKEGSYGR